MTRRRKTLGTVAVWLAGGAALAGGPPGVTVGGRQAADTPGDFPPPTAVPHFAGPSAASPRRLDAGFPAAMDPKPLPSPSMRSPELSQTTQGGRVKLHPYSCGPLDRDN